MKKYICSLVIICLLPLAGKSQLAFIGYAEYGYSFFKYKSNELQVFLKDYNETYPTLTTPFKMKMGVAKGSYYKFGVGMGSNVMAILDLAIYEVTSNPLEARFADGSGRDIWTEHRNSNSVVGIRVGGTKEKPFFFQFDLDVSIQQTYIYSAYVYPDGSRSLGNEKLLNGVYGDFVGMGGLGMTAGYRIIGPLAFNVSVNYMFNMMRGTPQYHQYTDLNDVKPDMAPDYLPRDLDRYYTDPYTTENSISNDWRGWKFNFGLVAMIGNWEE